MPKINPGSKEYFSFLNQVKEYYKKFERYIIVSSVKDRCQWYNAYAFDWVSSFSDAEYQTWCTLRSKYGCVLYPQYPVSKYYVDFGNPHLQIALEVDGKDYHNAEKDKIRDKEIVNMGWKIFRVTGAEVYREIEGFNEIAYKGENWFGLNNDEYTAVREWFLTTADGVIEAIKNLYFLQEPNDPLTELYKETLKAHSLVKFDL